MKTSILIADDEPNQLELMDFNLTNAGFSIIKASNGIHALELIENHSPDLIILDWMMPKMSGIDVCRTLRSRSETKSNNLPLENICPGLSINNVSNLNSLGPSFTSLFL